MQRFRTLSFVCVIGHYGAAALPICFTASRVVLPFAILFAPPLQRLAMENAEQPGPGLRAPFKPVQRLQKADGGRADIAMSRHKSRQKLTREFGATDILAERGDEEVARGKDFRMPTELFRTSRMWGK